MRIRQPEAQITQPISGEEQRGTEQSPLIIKVAPSTKTDDQRTEEAKEHERIAESDRKKEKSDSDLVKYTSELAFFTKGLFAATVALVLATFGLGVAAFFQGRDTKRAVIAAEQSAAAAKLSAEAAMGVELPIISLARLSLLKESGGIKARVVGHPGDVSIFEINFINLGRTAAELVNLCVEWAVVQKLPDMPAYKTSMPFAPGIFIEPGKTSPAGLHHYFIRLQPDEVTAIADEAKFLWVFGYLSFKDVILGHPREIRFCAKWQPYIMQPDGALSPLGFVHDSQTPPDYTKKN
jgi:hypothetical protein